MWGSVNKMYLTPHQMHIVNAKKDKMSHCGRRISGVAWYVAEYYMYTTTHSICKICLKIFHKLPAKRQLQGNAWEMEGE